MGVAVANKAASAKGFDLSQVRNRIIGHIELLPSEILDHPGQAWDHPASQAQALAGILGEVGIVDEILVYKSERAGGKWVTPDGHLRKSLDPKKLWPCTVLDLTDTEADYVLATKDPVAMMKQTNAAALDALLASVESSNQAVQEMLADVAKKAGLYLDREPQEAADAQTDNGEALRDGWGTDVGQLWGLGKHRLLIGDCADTASVARVLDGKKAQLIVTSPPYAVGKEYEVGVAFSEHLRLLRAFADSCLAALVPGGFIFINFQDIAPREFAGPLTNSKRPCIYPISKDYWQIFHEERHCDLYAQRIWYKPFARLVMPMWSLQNSTAHQQEWEHLWTWRVPGGSGDRRTDWDVSVRAVWDTRDELADKPLEMHVAAFPPGIPERALRSHSMSGEIVLDPFCGSGTTLIACEHLGRLGRGIELEPTYAAVILQRWVDTFGVKPELIDG